MADTQETRILKDINRHLAHMDEAEKGVVTDRLSPSETAAMNKNVQEIMGNFSSLVNAQLKNSIKATSDAISSAFGQVSQEFGEIAALDDIVDELKVNNQFADAADHNKFLEEQERETDLNINRRTNVLLEELLDKKDAEAKADKKDRDSGGGGGWIKGMFGGLLAGGGIKKLLGGVAKFGKKLFLPALILGAAAEFLRGWGEAGEDADTMTKFNSGLSRLLSDLTFGLVSKEFFENALVAIEGMIKEAWDGFTKSWDDFVTGKISGADFFANLLSSLSFGTVGPDVIKDIGRSIEEGFYDLISPMVDAVVLAFEDLIQMLFGDLVAGIKELVSNPLAFFKKSEKQKKLDDIKERAQKLQDEDKSLSEGDALRKAAKDRKEDPNRGGWLENLFRKPKPGDRWENGKWLRATETTAPTIKPQKAPEVKAKKKEPSNVGQEAVKKLVADEKRRRETKQDTGPGAALQINNNNTVSAPVDTQVENNDALNLNRSGGSSGSW